MKKIVFTLLLLLYSADASAQGDVLTVAVAANFLSPMQVLAEEFDMEHGVETDVVFGSTGMLYGKITNGAPYDVFFAADERRPRLLYAAGTAQEPVVYALGKIVLWAPEPSTLADGWMDALTDPTVTSVSLASPKTAPYGAAAEKALRTAGMYSAVEPKLVFAQTVAQAFQYAHSGATDAAFTALSYAVSKQGAAGMHLAVGADPVVQASCVIKASPHAEAAQAFVAYVLSEAGKAIIQRFGYARP